MKLIFTDVHIFKLALMQSTEFTEEVKQRNKTYISETETRKKTQFYRGKK